MEFSREEKGAILEALNGTILDEIEEDFPLLDAFSARPVRPGLGEQIAHELLEAIENGGLEEKWGIDRAGLVAKLEALSQEDRIKLARAVRAWWDRVEAGEQPDCDELRW